MGKKKSKSKIAGGMIAALCMAFFAIYMITATAFTGSGKPSSVENAVIAPTTTTAATVTTVAPKEEKAPVYIYKWDEDEVVTESGEHAFGLPVTTYCDESRDMYIEQKDIVHNGKVISVNGLIKKGEYIEECLKFSLESGKYTVKNDGGSYITLTVE